MNSTLSHALKRISIKYFQKAKIYALNGEPPCDRFLHRVPGVQVPEDEPAIPTQHSRQNPLAKTLDSLNCLHGPCRYYDYLSPRKGNRRLQFNILFSGTFAIAANIHERLYS